MPKSPASNRGGSSARKTNKATKSAASSRSPLMEMFVSMGRGVANAWRGFLSIDAQLRRDGLAFVLLALAAVFALREWFHISGSAGAFLHHVAAGAVGSLIEEAGGVLGWFMGYPLATLLSAWGGAIMLLLLFAYSILVYTQTPVKEVPQRVQALLDRISRRGEGDKKSGRIDSYDADEPFVSPNVSSPDLEAFEEPQESDFYEESPSYETQLNDPHASWLQ